MRWFFLLVIILVIVAGNTVALEKVSSMSILAAAVFNLFMAALIGFWWHVYYRQNDIGSNGFIYSGLLLLFALGGWIILLGTEQIISNSCEVLISHSDRSRLATTAVDTLMNYIQSVGYCRESGVVVIGLGLLVVLYAIKRFFRVKRSY